MTIPSSPTFFRLIRRAMLLCLAALGVLAWIFPAPLTEPANPGAPPNPARSAWFLLWIQELVSHGKWVVYPVFLLAFFFLFLPYLPPAAGAADGDGPPRGPKWPGVLGLLAFATILALTVVAMFFRGADWELRAPF